MRYNNNEIALKKTNNDNSLGFQTRLGFPSEGICLSKNNVVLLTQVEQLENESESS